MQVANGSVDFGMALGTYSRSQLVRFSHPVFRSQFLFLSGKPRPIPAYLSSLKPFSLVVWEMVALSFLSIILVLTLFHACFKRINFPGYVKGDFFKEVLLALSMMVQTARKPTLPLRSNAFRAAYLSSAIGAFLLCLSYRGNLLAGLVSVELEPKIATVEVLSYRSMQPVKALTCDETWIMLQRRETLS